MRFYWERVRSSRNFANKIWNASRFIMMNLEGKTVTEPKSLDVLAAEDKWILSHLNTVIREVTENMDKYELGIAVQKVYDFLWDELCDWYIELAKGSPVESGGKSGGCKRGSVDTPHCADRRTEASPSLHAVYYGRDFLYPDAGRGIDHDLLLAEVPRGQMLL